MLDLELKLYRVVINHPEGFGKAVTIREAAGINGKYVNSLYSGDVFTAEILGDIPGTGDLWARIYEYSNHPEWSGKYVGIRYQGRNFATWQDLSAPSPDKILAWVYPNWVKPFYRFPTGRPAIPDTRAIMGARVAFNGRNLLSERHQYWIYNNIKARCPEFFTEEANAPTAAYPRGGQGIAKFNKDFVYFFDDKLFQCNDHGSRKGAVYPAGHNLTSKQTLLQNQLAMGGKIIELWDTTPRTILGKANQIPFKCIDTLNKHIEDFDSVSCEYGWARPSITFGHESKREEPFSVFNGKARYPIMLNGSDTAYIGADLIMIIDQSKPLPQQFTKDWGS